MILSIVTSAKKSNSIADNSQNWPFYILQFVQISYYLIHIATREFELTYLISRCIHSFTPNSTHYFTMEILHIQQSSFSCSAFFHLKKWQNFSNAGQRLDKSSNVLHIFISLLHDKTPQKSSTDISFIL
jgi:hypothetical protein